MGGGGSENWCFCLVISKGGLVWFSNFLDGFQWVLLCFIGFIWFYNVCLFCVCVTVFNGCFFQWCLKDFTDFFGLQKEIYKCFKPRNLFVGMARPSIFVNKL